jgi:hypothetical protein
MLIDPTQSVRGHMFHGSETDGDGWGGTDDHELHLSMENGGEVELRLDSDGKADAIVETSDSVNDDTWHHLAATWAIGADVTLYLDGEVVGTSNHNGANFSFIGSMRLARPYAVQRFYIGLMDDVRLYNRALDQPEVLDTMVGDPLVAKSPSPGNESTVDISEATPFTWNKGDLAGEHSVYFGTDMAAVRDADASDTTGIYRGRQSTTSYTPPEGVEFGGGPYYWRVDENNSDGTVSDGLIWSFSVADYLIVEDFESYNDIEAGQPGSNLVYLTWKDGFDNPATNGSTMGYPTGPSMETDTVHGGLQSAPVMYNNVAVSISEVQRTFAVPQNWTNHGVTTLSLWFFGAVTNIGGQMYAKINGVEVAYDGDAGNLRRPLWQIWNIDLASLGVNPQSVTSLLIGIRGPGATGTLIFDDIRLYRSAPEPPDEIWLEAEAASTLGASWRTYNDPASSAGLHIGSEDGAGDDNDIAPGAEWTAAYSFNAAGGIYKILLRAQEIGSDSFWVRIVGATSQTHEDPDQPGTGWVRFNGIDAPDGWNWDEVHSDDHGQAVVNWTLPAGAHALEIAKREDGVLLDAILITTDVE